MSKKPIDINQKKTEKKLKESIFDVFEKRKETRENKKWHIEYYVSPWTKKGIHRTFGLEQNFGHLDMELIIDEHLSKRKKREEIKEEKERAKKIFKVIIEAIENGFVYQEGTYKIDSKERVEIKRSDEVLGEGMVKVFESENKKFLRIYLEK